MIFDSSVHRIDRARRTPSRAVGPRAFAPTPTMTSITPILAATQSPDVAARVAAEDALKNAEASDAGAYAKALVDELACASAPLATRQLAGVILKNTLDAKDEAKRRELRERWMTRDAATREEIKRAAWGCLACGEAPVRSVAAQVVAKIAGAEVPRKAWPDLIPSLQRGAQGGGDAGREAGEPGGAGVRVRGGGRGRFGSSGRERGAHGGGERDGTRGNGRRRAVGGDAGAE